VYCLSVYLCACVSVYVWCLLTCDVVSRLASTTNWASSCTSRSLCVCVSGVCSPEALCTVCLSVYLCVCVYMVSAHLRCCVQAGDYEQLGKFMFVSVSVSMCECVYL